MITIQSHLYTNSTVYGYLNEPIYYENEREGLITSGAYGFRVNKSLAFGYVNSDLIKNDTEFLIDIQGKKVKAKIIEEPAFDPKNLRLKS